MKTQRATSTSNLYVHRLTCELDERSPKNFEYDMCIEIGDRDSSLKKFISNSLGSKDWTAEVELAGTDPTIGHKDPVVEVFDNYSVTKTVNLEIFLKAGSSSRRKGKIKIRDSKHPIIDPRIKKLEFIRVDPNDNRYTMTIEMLATRLDRISIQNLGTHKIIAVYEGDENDPMVLTETIDLGEFDSVELAEIVVDPDPPNADQSDAVVYFNV